MKQNSKNRGVGVCPPTLTGGGGRTDLTRSKLQHVPLSDCPPERGRLLAHGWDYWQEALNIAPGLPLEAKLEQAREAAEAADCEIGFELAGTKFLMRPYGVRGRRFVFRNDDVMIMMGRASQDWATTIRFSSAGIWEHGVRELSWRYVALLASAGANILSPPTEDAGRVTRCDYAFDFHSPSFTDEVNAGLDVVAHAKVKSRDHGKLDACEVSGWGTSINRQTFTLGAITGLQVQIYNKTDEIKEASGKSWLYGLWARGADGLVFEKDVWRLEIRFGKNFLEERNARRSKTIENNLDVLLHEALVTRRVVVPSNDTNRRRWPLHPLWSEAARQAGQRSFLPLGRQVTGKRSELVRRAEKQIAGSLLAATVLEFGDYSPAGIEKAARAAVRWAAENPQRRRRVGILKDRYHYVDEAS